MRVLHRLWFHRSARVACRALLALALVLVMVTPAFASSSMDDPPTTLYFAEGSTQRPFDTWFLVENPNRVAATVTFTFEFQGGGGTSRTFVVGPTSRFSLFANQIIPNVAFSTRINSDQQVFAERSMFVGFDGTDVPGITSPNKTWLFAEGSTQSPFQSWLLIQNPGGAAATATIHYFLANGAAPATQVLSLPPASRTSVFVNQILPNQAYSAQVTADQPIVVEQSMFRFPGNAAAAVAGATAPGPNWFFANAQTGNHSPVRASVPFDSFLLFQNPNSTAVTATATLFRENGTNVTVTLSLPPNSRQTLFLNQVLPGTTMGVAVHANGNIVVQRSMFFGPEPRGAMEIVGASALQTQWFLAEGSTQPPFTQYIYILNPNSATMTAHIDFLLPGGQVVGRDFTIGAGRPITINVNSIVPNTPNSARVTTSLPSVVERQMFFVKIGSLGGTDAIGIP